MSTLNINLPDSLLEQLRLIAKEKNEPVETAVARAVSEHIAAYRRFATLRASGQAVSPERFREVLRKAPDVEPAREDQRQ